MTGVELERKVKEILKKDSWEITPSAYYTDPITQKPREKDIIATKAQLSNKELTKYCVRLFIECKVFPKSTEVYEYPNPEKIEKAMIHYNIPFAKFDEIEKHEREKIHFYEHQSVFEPKDSRDFLYPAINQSLQSFDAFRKYNNERGLYFLIVVYDGKLFCVDNNDNKKEIDNALVKIKVLDNTFCLPNRECFVELTSIDKFENLVERIKNDTNPVDSSVCFYCRSNEYKQRALERMQKNSAR